MPRYKVIYKKISEKSGKVSSDSYSMIIEESDESCAAFYYLNRFLGKRIGEWRLREIYGPIEEIEEIKINDMPLRTYRIFHYFVSKESGETYGPMYFEYKSTTKEKASQYYMENLFGRMDIGCGRLNGHIFKIEEIETIEKDKEEKSRNKEYILAVELRDSQGCLYLSPYPIDEIDFDYFLRRYGRKKQPGLGIAGIGMIIEAHKLGKLSLKMIRETYMRYLYGVEMELEDGRGSNIYLGPIMFLKLKE